MLLNNCNIKGFNTYSTWYLLRWGWTEKTQEQHDFISVVFIQRRKLSFLAVVIYKLNILTRRAMKAHELRVSHARLTSVFKYPNQNPMFRQVIQGLATTKVSSSDL